MTNTKSSLPKQNLASVFLYLGSSCQDTIHIYFMILSLIIISHLWGLRISIIPDIKDYIMKLLYLLSIIFQMTTSRTQKFSDFKNKKNIIIPHTATLQGWIEIVSLNNDNKI